MRGVSRVLAASAILVAASARAGAAQSISVYQTSPVRTPQQWALLVGRDDPGSPSQDTATSVEGLRDLLRSLYGFRADRVRVLLGPEATQAGILESLLRMTGEVGPSDGVFVFLGLPEIQREGASYLVPADGREAEPWTLVAREEVVRTFAKSSGAPVLIVLPACVLRSFPNQAQQREAGTPTWLSEQLSFVSLLTFCGSLPDAGRAAVAGELKRYLDSRVSFRERIPGRQVVSELSGPLRTRSVIVDWLSRAVDEAQEFAFVPARDHLGALLAQLHEVEDPEGRAQVILEIVKVALGAPDERRPEATGRAAAALVRVAGDRSQPGDLRYRAVQAVGDLRDPGVLAALRTLYGQAEPLMRKQVVDAVGRLGGDSPLAFLRGALGDSDATVRIAAVRAVGANRDEASLPRILRLMRVDRSPDVRLAALQTSLLFKAQPHDLRAAIAPMLRDADPGVRREAAGALGSFGGDGAAPDLLAALETERTDTVREALIFALGRSSGEADRPAVEAAIVSALSPPNPLAVRTAAAWALGAIHATGAGAALTAALDDPSDPMKVSAVAALGALKHRPAVDKIIALLGEGSPMVKRAAATALGSIGDARAGDALLAALKDTDASVSASAGEALKRVQPKELEAALHDRSPAVRLKATQALVANGGNANGPVLVRLLSDGDYEVRRAAIKALASDDFATTDNLSAVAAALRDKDPQKRVGALIVLGQVAARPSHRPLPAFEDALADSLKDPGADVRAEAVRTAGNMRDQRWLQPLVDAARDPAPHVRQASAEALGNQPSSQAVAALRRLMADDVSDVRLAALTSLRRLEVK